MYLHVLQYYIIIQFPKQILQKHSSYEYMRGSQSYLLPAMNMAKLGGTLSVVKVCMCESQVSVSGWSPIGCFAQI